MLNCALQAASKHQTEQVSLNRLFTALVLIELLFVVLQLETKASKERFNYQISMECSTRVENLNS